ALASPTGMPSAIRWIAAQAAVAWERRREWASVAWSCTRRGKRTSRAHRQMGRNMRHLIVLLAAGIAAALSGAATAQDRPAIETTKVEGTDNVYIFRNV